MGSISVDEIKKWLRENLDAERYEHSLGVAECAYEMAQKYGLDSDKAYLTGLVHDCAKCMNREAQERIIRDYLTVEDCELINPKTYHAPVGSYVAQKEFGIEEDEILSAIRWHTVGKMSMSVFEKVIFIADKIEPKTRPVEYINKIKPRLEEENGLDMALLECYKGTIKSLADRELKICISTIEIYNELLEKYENNK